jgi:serine/threonine protein phosphatase PrpC
MRKGRLEQLTQDHAMVEDLVASGALTREQAENHPQANRITRAVGAGPKLFVDIELFEVHPGDRFMLCSDGLYKELRDPEIAVALTSRNPAAQELVDQAVAKGARDNVTVIDIRMER